MLHINPSLVRFAATTTDPVKNAGVLSRAAGETASKASGVWESLKSNLAAFANWVRTTLSSAWATVRAFVQMKPALALAGAAAIGAAIYAIAARVFSGKKEEKTEAKKEEKTVTEEQKETTVVNKENTNTEALKAPGTPVNAEANAPANGENAETPNKG